jgi:hypothetical protein
VIEMFLNAKSVFLGGIVSEKDGCFCRLKGNKKSNFVEIG